ncbi:Type 1 glutamine amidotransferase-like domain-containing protein [Neosynechococcus sphagnicola]|uniref:Type 1 glutamine amidotransferase-like domain-containing protein n=1 Tax=Neosynechococcus sphagnicola TaxID=1501145 RepID=UPI000A5263E1
MEKSNLFTSSISGILEHLIHGMPRDGDMLQLESQTLEPKYPQPLKTAVMVIGGAEDKVHGREILQAFFRRAGAAEARIAIIPSASREPVVSGETYRTIFEKMGASAIEVLDIRDRDQAEAPRMKEFIDGVTGVFMTGGRSTEALWHLGRYSPDE